MILRRIFPALAVAAALVATPQAQPLASYTLTQFTLSDWDGANGPIQGHSNSQIVRIAAAVAGSGANALEISPDQTFRTQVTTVALGSPQYVLPNGVSGSYTLHARARGGGSERSNVLSATITLDTIRPEQAPGWALRHIGGSTNPNNLLMQFTVKFTEPVRTVIRPSESVPGFSLNCLQFSYTGGNIINFVPVVIDYAEPNAYLIQVSGRVAQNGTFTVSLVPSAVADVAGNTLFVPQNGGTASVTITGVPTPTPSPTPSPTATPMPSPSPSPRPSRTPTPTPSPSPSPTPQPTPAPIQQGAWESVLGYRAGTSSDDVNADGILDCADLVAGS